MGHMRKTGFSAVHKKEGSLLCTLLHSCIIWKYHVGHPKIPVSLISCNKVRLESFQRSIWSFKCTRVSFQMVWRCAELFYLEQLTNIRHQLRHKVSAQISKHMLWYTMPQDNIFYSVSPSLALSDLLRVCICKFGEVVGKKNKVCTCFLLGFWAVAQQCPRQFSRMACSPHQKVHRHSFSLFRGFPKLAWFAPSAVLRN